MDNNDNSYIQTQEQDFNAGTVTDSERQSPSSNYFGNNSFSGSDMIAIMHMSGVEGVKGTYTLGSLQTLSYSTSMQRAPIRSIGNINAKDYVMGQRTIAGSLVFAVFDKHFAYEAMKAIRGITEEDYHFLADELPPFDITITFANEYGKIAKLAIYGVRLVNEGQVMSINDIYTENTYQYVATDIDYLSDKTTNTSGMIYTPLKPSPNSVSEPIALEDITIDEPENEEDDISKYQLVYVKATDAYVADGIQVLGKISLDLFKKVEYGNIHIQKIDSEFERSYDLTPGVQFPIVDTEVPEGKYVARYFSGKSFSKSTEFTINNKKQQNPKPERPIIVLEEKHTDGSFTIGIQAVDAYTVGFQYTTTPKDESSWKKIDPPAAYSVLKGLKEYTTYSFRAYNQSEVSPEITCYTDGKKEHLFSDFKGYVEANKSYLTNEWPYFESMWDLIYAEWLVEPTGSVSIALQKIKPKLDLVDVGRKKAYDRICDIATRYEKEQAFYISQNTKLNTPKVIDQALRVIEFEKNITSLEITCVQNNFKEKVNLLSFQVVNDKYRYTINSKYLGMHKVVAKNALQVQAPELLIYIPERLVADAMILQSITDVFDYEKEIAAAKLELQSSFVLTSQNNKDLLLKELNNNNKVSKQGIASPIIIYATEDELKVSCSIPAIYTKQCYLCLYPTEDLGIKQLKRRVLITKNEFTHIFYRAKHALINGRRYCLWIENSDNEVVSTTTGVDFNSIKSETQKQKNAETVTAAKKEYSYDYTKALADAYIEEEALADASIYRGVIGDVIVDTPSTDSNKFNYVYDAIAVRHKNEYGTFSVSQILNLKVNFDTCLVTGRISDSNYTIAILVQYKGNQYSVSRCTPFGENTFLLDSLNTSNDYAYVYFTNSNQSKVSPLMLFDLKNKKSKSTMKMEVLWI